MSKSVFHNLYSQLALDICRGPWLLHNAEAHLPLVQAFFSRVAPVVERQSFTPLAIDASGEYIDREEGKPSTPKEYVAIIPVVGTITKYDSCATIGATTLAEALHHAAIDSKVVGVVLDIDSGGGSCSAIPLMREAITAVRNAGKPIITHADLCASAAYWIASMTDAIFADNEFSEFGSIGVMAQMYRPADNVITIYAEESPDKNHEYRAALDGDITPTQQALSPIVAAFHRDVMAGRPSLRKETPGLLSGAMFPAARAIEAGLANAMATLDDCVQNVFLRASNF